MNSGSQDADDRLWQEIIDAQRRLHEARLRFAAQCRDKPRVIAAALLGGHRATALALLPTMPPDTQAAVFPILVELAATGHSTIGLVRAAILAMPRQWVVEHIEQRMEPFLEAVGDEAYRRYAELLLQLDAQLLHRLAARAQQSSDPHIREVGEDFRHAEALGPAISPADGYA